jgi:hypothetical protein
MQIIGAIISEIRYLVEYSITIIEIQENKEKIYNYLELDDKMNKDRLKVNIRN